MDIDEQEEEEEQKYDQRKVPKQLCLDDSSYEGDESGFSNSNNTMSESSSTISIGLASNSFGLDNKYNRRRESNASSDQDDEAVEIAGKDMRVVKRVARLKIGMEGGNDGTLERTTGSTSSPISVDNSRSGMVPAVRRRKPILCIPLH